MTASHGASGHEAELWQAADTLRGSMDAAEYKHIVLGLIFLKYVSDSFEERRAELAADPHSDEEDPDFYRGENLFWAPAEARWARLRDAAASPGVGRAVDAAMDAIERDNAALRGVLPRDYARPALDARKLGDLIRLVGGVRVGGAEARSRDVLGGVYEYFLSRFAAAEGKRGGEFYTPLSVVRLLVAMLQPWTGRVYDPCCGSAGMFVQSIDFVERRATGNGNGGRARAAVSVFGQESNYTTYGERLGLGEDEAAFYDALAANDSAVAVLGEETLCGIARELIGVMRRDATADWTLRENVQAKLRASVKRILSRYGYPPDRRADATRLVIEQTEALSAAWRVAG